MTTMQAANIPGSDRSAARRPPAPRSVAQAIAEQLELWGAKRIYGVAGDAIFGLMDALAGQKTIEFVSVKHESAAAMMASAEAKLTGRIAVCMAQAGPGLTNLVTGLGDAYLDHAPVLAITGQAPLNKIGTPYKQFINQQQLMQAVSSYTQMVAHPDAAIESLTQAMTVSSIHRTVSHLSVPSDVFGMPTAAPTQGPILVPAPASDRNDLRRALLAMRSAKRPFLAAGSGARPARELIGQLADRWGSAVAYGYGAAGLVPDSHPLLVNGLGEGGNPFLPELYREADVVLAVETAAWPDELVSDRALVIRLTDRPDRAAPSVYDIGIVGHPADVLRQWLEGLNGYEPNAQWIRQVEQCRRSFAEQNEKERNVVATPLHPASIVRAVERFISEDAIVALDEGDLTLWFLRGFRAKRHEIVLSDRWRTMGFGLPAAMAAKFCFPGRQVVCLTGDGGLGMVLADLITAARYKLPIIVVVFNNGTLQMEHDKMRMKGLRPEGVAISNPDFVQVAKACGWNGVRIATVGQLEDALLAARDGDKPVLLDVQTAQVPHPDFIPT
ncbi:thiamine pyrophosphate-binding protein [Paenibacillus sp. GYB003]|uniref:thiamine pyrophosphate-binding protein n=1 Tax=Paenibacillus sp. GYB003 TaxID=2994392 RepID=UPI002F9674D3